MKKRNKKTEASDFAIVAIWFVLLCAIATGAILIAINV
jgi:hypothetical protein